MKPVGKKPAGFSFFRFQKFPEFDERLRSSNIPGPRGTLPRAAPAPAWFQVRPGGRNVHVADDFTVLMGPEGPNARRIEGLFGAGGAIGNTITNSGLGAHNATAIGSGALAGAEAAKYAERN